MDTKPKGIVIPETCDDYEALLNDAQLMKASESYPIYMTDDILLFEDDDMTGGRTVWNFLQRLYTFDSKVFGNGEWTYSYQRIYTYNVIISDIMQSTGSTEKHKKEVLAPVVGRALNI